jgi:hypothetical protein
VGTLGGKGLRAGTELAFLFLSAAGRALFLANRLRKDCILADSVVHCFSRTMKAA